MNRCEIALGSILKTAEDISLANPQPSLRHIQAQTGLTTEEMVAALEFVPQPLGWHLEQTSPHRSGSFVVHGKTYTSLVINRFALS